jgi:hypothetical protein
METITHELVLGNLFVRPNLVENPGDFIQGHTHNYDHVSFFHTPWRVEATLPDGREIVRDFPAGSFALIKADVSHKLTALPHEVEAHTQALLDAVVAVSEGLAGVETLAPAVATWKQRHESQPHHFWCAFAHETPQGNVGQKYSGWEPAYT